MRTRRRIAFAAPLVLIAGCDLYVAPDTFDAQVVSDAMEHPPDGWPVSENPPPPVLGNECTPQGPLDPFATPCEAEVCSFDPACCTEAWSVRCTQLASRSCDLYCNDVLTFAGDDGVGFVSDGAASALDTGDSAVVSAAWADHDGDWLASLATMGDCTARIFLLGVEQFARTADDCATFHGRRARWADVDGDRRLDAVFIGDGGAFWIHARPDGGWDDGGAIVSDVGLADLVLTDLDGDGKVDAIAAFDAGPARIYRQGIAGAFTRDDGWGSLGDATRLALCDVADTGATELVLAGPAGVELAARADLGLAPPVLLDGNGATDLACGLGALRDRIVTAGSDGAIRELDATGVIWDSTGTLSIPGAHVAIAGAAIVVVPPARSGTIPYLSIEGGVIATGVDARPDRAAGEVGAADVRGSL